MRVIVIGAGIIGCALAQELTRRGLEVVVIDAAQGAGQGATGASFGWINASYFVDSNHLRLRIAAMAGWAAWMDDPGLPNRPASGALWFEAQGDELDAMAVTLANCDYGIEFLETDDIIRTEPALRNPPGRALLLQREGCAEPVPTCHALLAAAVQRGARCIFGCGVTGIAAGRVETEQGSLSADRIVVATGTGAPHLLAPLGCTLPMLDRPGAILRSKPLRRMLGNILVTPLGEVRQDGKGALVMPCSVGHQADSSDRITAPPEELARDAAARLRNLLVLPDDFDWAEIALADRPVPQDGLPVIGKVVEGIYVAVMHSGVTLAPVAASHLACELLGSDSPVADLMAPYRPDRFAA